MRQQNPNWAYDPGVWSIPPFDDASYFPVDGTPAFGGANTSTSAAGQAAFGANIPLPRARPDSAPQAADFTGSLWDTTPGPQLPGVEAKPQTAWDRITAPLTGAPASSKVTIWDRIENVFLRGGVMILGFILIAGALFMLKEYGPNVDVKKVLR